MLLNRAWNVHQRGIALVFVSQARQHGKFLCMQQRRDIARDDDINIKIQQILFAQHGMIGIEQFNFRPPAREIMQQRHGFNPIDVSGIGQTHRLMVTKLLVYPLCMLGGEFLALL